MIIKLEEEQDGERKVVNGFLYSDRKDWNFIDTCIPKSILMNRKAFFYCDKSHFQYHFGNLFLKKSKLKLQLPTRETAAYFFPKMRYVHETRHFLLVVHVVHEHMESGDLSFPPAHCFLFSLLSFAFGGKGCLLAMFK